jgi:hypothetical protein
LGRDGKRRRLPTPASKVATSEPLPVASSSAADDEARGVVLKIARQLADVEEAIRAALVRYPHAKPLLSDFIAKARQDRGFLEKEIITLEPL